MALHRHDAPRSWSRGRAWTRLFSPLADTGTSRQIAGTPGGGACAPPPAVGDGALGSGPRCWSSSRRPLSSAAGSTRWWRILALCPGKGPLQSVRSRRLPTAWCVCAWMAYGIRRHWYHIRCRITPPHGKASLTPLEACPGQDSARRSVCDPSRGAAYCVSRETATRHAGQQPEISARSSQPERAAADRRSQLARDRYLPSRTIVLFWEPGAHRPLRLSWSGLSASPCQLCASGVRW